MDIVWIAAVAALWGLIAEMVVGLNLLAQPKRQQPAKPGERA
ncbi:hypothetical protein BH10PSE18_BH10PSE18_47670 [soil metagenome]